MSLSTSVRRTAAEWEKLAKCFTPETIKAMREWALECAVDSYDESEIQTSADWRIFRNVCMHFDGGLEGFLICM
jgi:hypothetical protein